MASRALLATATRRALLATARRSYQTSAVQHLGGLPPPLPPFARSPRRTQPIPENADSVWDDGVAPELALDFDAPHISSLEALLTLSAMLGTTTAIWFGFKYLICSNDELYDRPCVDRSMSIVDKDHTEDLQDLFLERWAKVEKEAAEKEKE